MSEERGGASGDEAGDPPNLCYLDHNTTTLMPQEVLDAMVEWANRGDPSAEYASAREARKMMDQFRKAIAVECGFELESPRSKDAFDVIFTSGASESNCSIVTSAARSYLAKTQSLPHIITSAAEHKSLLLCCLRLAKERLCLLTVLPVGKAGPGLGAVDPAELERAVRKNTCLISITAANGETGVMNNLRALAEIAHRTRIPFHTDASQLFGRSVLRPKQIGVDAFSASFHKLHGPPGVGVLVVRRSFTTGYDLQAHICGPQNGGLRGGTENVPGIAASLVAFRLAMQDRAQKSGRILKLRNAIKAAVATVLPCFAIDDHPGAPDSAETAADGSGAPDGASAVPHRAPKAVRRALAASEKQGTPVVFWIAPEDDRTVLPNTLLLAVRRPGFCNRAARAALERRGVIVGLCAPSPASSPAGGPTSAAASAVAALGLHPDLHRGVLRVSLGDDTSAEDVKKFVREFLVVVRSDECLRQA
jgi:cysteine desulfurase